MSVPCTKSLHAFFECLKRAGLIRYHNIKNGRIEVALAYDNAMRRVITSTRMISKPSIRRHMNCDEIKKLSYSGGYYIVSTDKGWLTSKECLANGVGGMVSCHISKI